ncbi:MAG: large conductance mechanosensitive channel protein MscL [Candidatus Caenarcaniphilales bacterium]|nr:large conductance mechanosensitive channel protein MscL [Candidatus Caenarcaniphilales bacterium]
MSLINEFKEFAVKGNTLDLAIGVILAGAFGKITESLVKDIIMPPIGLLLGNVDFNNIFIALNGVTYHTLEAAQKAGAPTLNFGIFVTTIINFLIVAIALFTILKALKETPSQSS